MSLVCWSGGADSTLVLHDLLREQKKAKVKVKKRSKQERTDGLERKLLNKKNPSDVTDVRTISIRHMQLGANKEQFEARKRIREILRGRGLRFKRAEISFRHRGGFHVKPRGCTQAMVWLSVVMPYLRSGENLYIGYVGGDSVWSHWANLRRVFDSGATLLGLENVDLITPLYGVSKAEVLHRLRRARLVRATWTCEDPKDGRACGQCTPCRRMVMARYELRRWPAKEG